MAAANNPNTAIPATSAIVTTGVPSLLLSPVTKQMSKLSLAMKSINSYNKCKGPGMLPKILP